MIALKFLPFLKTVLLKFTFYALNGVPMLFLFLGKDNIPYSIFAAFFAYIAVYFLRREIKKYQPVHEKNVTEYIAVGLTLLFWASLIFSRFYGFLS